MWSLTAAAPSDSIFRALCIDGLTYLLTYLQSSQGHRLTSITYTFIQLKTDYDTLLVACKNFIYIRPEILKLQAFFYE